MYTYGNKYIEFYNEATLEPLTVACFGKSFDDVRFIYVNVPFLKAIRDARDNAAINNQVSASLVKWRDITESEFTSATVTQEFYEHSEEVASSSLVS